MYECVSGLTTVFVVGTAVWELSSTSSWDRHQTWSGYWYKKGQKVRRNIARLILQDKRVQGVNNILDQKKKNLTEGNYSLLETWASAPNFGRLSKHQRWGLERNMAILERWLLYYSGTCCVRRQGSFSMGYKKSWIWTHFKIWIQNYSIIRKLWILDCTIHQDVIENVGI